MIQPKNHPKTYPTISVLTKNDLSYAFTFALATAIAPAALIGRSGVFVAFACTILMILYSILKDLKSYQKPYHHIIKSHLGLNQKNITLYASFLLFLMTIILSALSATDPWLVMKIAFRLFIIAFFTLLMIYHIKMRSHDYHHSHTNHPILSKLTDLSFMYPLWIIIFTLCAFLNNIIQNHDLALSKNLSNLSICLILPLIFLMYQKQSKHQWLIGFALATLCLIPFSLIFTHYLLSDKSAFTSTAFLGFLTMICSIVFIWFVHRFLKKQSSILIILAVLGSVFLSISIPSIYLAKIEIWPAFGKTQNYIPLIDEHREAIWHKSIQLFKKAPITGYGAKHANQIEPADVYFRSTGISLFRKNFSEKELIDIKNLSYVKPYEYMPIHPHHVIFELMLELGWFGFLAFIIMISIWSAKITQMPLIEKTYGMSLFFTIFMVWLFTHSFWSSWFHIFIAGLIFLLINTPLKNRIT